MKKLITRALSGLVFITIVIGAIFLGQYAHAILFLFVSIGCMIEFYTALINKGVDINIKIGVIVGTIIYATIISVALFNGSFASLLITIPVLFLIWILQLWQKNQKPFETISYTLCGAIYIAVPLALTIHVAKPMFLTTTVTQLAYYPFIMLGVMILQWVSDTFAYLTGICIGKHPLFKRHSPKKSWEGFVGGFLFCVLAGYLIGTYVDTPFDKVDWIVMSIMIPPIGTLGDLVESMFKRSMDIKDTGNIMPGHGGLLDRFDSLIMTTPFILGYLLIKYLVY